ncbi:MAG: translocation/assembly module TamB domain-containing protein, partial [Bacteroidales bacterium]|nr:translocation/assembly module TamB domain-containing protein [Bacteroidales bacterium]
TSMKIDFLQTRYTMNDSIRFDKNNIIFRNIRLLDEKGNSATLNGSVFHDYFKNYRADLLINTDECMVLNTKPRDNDIFYGTAYATGVTTIKSGTNSLSFDISAKTDRNTKIYIPLNSSETVSDYSFITFVSHDTISEVDNKPSLISRAPDKETAMDLNFDLEITPDAEIQLIFDSKVGDIMQGRGSGRLNISLNSRDEFGISGDYIIDAGDYLFTLGNILNKPFTVENGGKITFSGNIDDAEIDIKAIYKLRASLYEILQDERYNERIPVECHIDLSGKLFNPVIGLDIFLPTADESTRTYLKNVITTEEERSRQFLYLLVMNSFYSDPTYRSALTSASSPATGTSAMAVTTTEMVSNQLSNWLSQISNDFDIGFVYRPGYKDISSNEVQLALSTQLLNDKVIINGNFDVRGAGGTSDNTNQMSGDFDIEYKITDRIRFKVFNRFNNPYTGKQAPYTQGFGLFYRQEFDKFSDLFRKTEKSEMKKEEEPAVSDI